MNLMSYLAHSNPLPSSQSSKPKIDQTLIRSLTPCHPQTPSNYEECKSRSTCLRNPSCFPSPPACGRCSRTPHSLAFPSHHAPSLPARQGLGASSRPAWSEGWVRGARAVLSLLHWLCLWKPSLMSGRGSQESWNSCVCWETRA
jgi:hypothetical protein